MRHNKTIRLNHWKYPNLVLFCFLIVILVLFARFAYLSLSNSIDNINLKEFAANRNTVSSKIYAKRGTIFDINGEPLAQNVVAYNLYAYIDPAREKDYVVDKEYTATILSQVLSVDYEYILKRLNAEAKVVYFGYAGSNITELTKIKIEEYDLPGVKFEKTLMRYYPNGNFASYILGYAKKDELEDGNAVISGKLGIEQTYDEVLKGVDGYTSYQQDKYGNKIPNTPEIVESAIDGYDIYLTIDSSIQRFAENAIKTLVDKYSPEWGMFTVMDAKTGEILASSTSPNYDPNSIPSNMTYQNPLVSYTYEPGSTMKIYTYMCAIDKGNYDGEKKYLSGTYQISDEEKISDWKPKGWGNISYNQGFQYSSNVAIVNIINDYLDTDDLYNCLDKYGFGKSTNSELSNEAKGNIDYYYKIELYTAGFGQGISITAIQQLQALSIIANNGKMVKPHIISKIVDPNTNSEEVTKIEYSEQLVKESTVSKIKDLMESVVSDSSATGAKYAIDGYDIIAKTGTAQIYENGKYTLEGNDYIVSVALMFPKDDPQYIIYAIAKRPKQINSALIEPTKNLIKNIAKYKEMFATIDQQSSLETYQISSYINKNTKTVSEQLSDQSLTPIVIGNGSKIISQYPKAGTQLVAFDKVFLLTNDSNYKVLDMTDWSYNDVEAFCHLVDITCTKEGYGYVKKQSIAPGLPIADIHFVLENKINTKNS